ncbi:50S ribosomal protein L10 [Enemella evansiae]|uniref:Large ribosomal subunit protein uL10 n=1 Tax=Enemella evansiae TaxID=2016499 RepID=A0A255GJZ3_9ACTN|nr:50S ribosomal protein L10 [Enemella evansiae]PFG68557.1 large subunit ribosomal protein L10 [Propionibacteriaceae bacterium ES.041]OYN95417.1 50S ribosomal protein L10 [Enemella evansiae]OYO01728.1 50S ribosomal protein L10 [Enemella evansiae]OYO03525.1 50S ribosomal protein L10 [Enemella evansiae]OYO09951.1 50S ribosomal protein L10 [Enemella evansiae]
MARPDKAAAVAELKEKFSSSEAAVLTEYRGLSVAALKELRRSLGEDATYAVTKNTLTQIAAKEAGVEGLDEQLVGPTAIAFITGDVATVAKGLRNFSKDNPLLVIKGGVMEGKILDADGVKALADLESREVLLAKLAGGMKANLNKAAYVFAAPASKLARALGALETAAQEDPSKIGGAGAATADQKQVSDEAAPAAGNDEAAPAAENTDTAADDSADEK